MSNTTDLLLRQATASTFEELAFLYPEDADARDAIAVDSSPSDADSPIASAAVDFHGPLRGRLVLRVSARLLPVIAANMLGEQESQFTPLQRDALGEIANVVCGNLLPALAGADAVFRLDAPQWRGSGTDARDGDRPYADATLNIEGGSAKVELFVFTGREWLASRRPAHATA